MKGRRWFVTPELLQWKYMCACGDYFAPFFSFPYEAGISIDSYIKQEVRQFFMRSKAYRESFWMFNNG